MSKELEQAIAFALTFVKSAKAGPADDLVRSAKQLRQALKFITKF